MTDTEDALATLCRAQTSEIATLLARVRDREAEIARLSGIVAEQAAEIGRLRRDRAPSLLDVDRAIDQAAGLRAAVDAMPPAPRAHYVIRRATYSQSCGYEDREYLDAVGRWTPDVMAARVWEYGPALLAMERLDAQGREISLEDFA